MTKSFSRFKGAPSVPIGPAKRFFEKMIAGPRGFQRGLKLRGALHFEKCLPVLRVSTEVSKLRKQTSAPEDDKELFKI